MPTRWSGPNPGLIIFALILIVGYAVLRDTDGEVAVFGGINRRIDGEFSGGGKATAVFGGYKLDLSDAQMRGQRATIDVNAFFGGAEVRVPEDWRVIVEASTVFGGINDSTRQPLPGPDTKELVVDGVAVFGGIRVRN
jgi:Cell wall-active antibiotics response LiaF, C-terminal